MREYVARLQAEHDELVRLQGAGAREGDREVEDIDLDPNRN